MNNIAAMIVGQTFHYEKLSIDLLYQYIDTTRQHLISPRYLFMTEQGERDLADMWKERRTYELKKPYLFAGMFVIALPMLPENTLIIGTLVLNEDPFQALSDRLS
jgi:hypothetical protein